MRIAEEINIRYVFYYVYMFEIFDVIVINVLIKIIKRNIFFISLSTFLNGLNIVYNKHFMLSVAVLKLLTNIAYVKIYKIKCCVYLISYPY